MRRSGSAAVSSTHGRKGRHPVGRGCDDLGHGEALAPVIVDIRKAIGVIKGELGKAEG